MGCKTLEVITRGYMYMGPACETGHGLQDAGSDYQRLHVHGTGPVRQTMGYKMMGVITRGYMYMGPGL